jgi:hypothetical protein
MHGPMNVKLPVFFTIILSGVFGMKPVYDHILSIVLIIRCSSFWIFVPIDSSNICFLSDLLHYWHVYVLPLVFSVWPCKPYPTVTSRRDIVRYWYEYRVSRDAFCYLSYALRKHVWERGLWGVGKQWTEKMIRIAAIHVTCIWVI